MLGEIIVRFISAIRKSLIANTEFMRGACRVWIYQGQAIQALSRDNSALRSQLAILEAEQQKLAAEMVNAGIRMEGNQDLRNEIRSVQAEVGMHGIILTKLMGSSVGNQ